MNVLILHISLFSEGWQADFNEPNDCLGISEGIIFLREIGHLLRGLPVESKDQVRDV